MNLSQPGTSQNHGLGGDSHRSSSPNNGCKKRRLRRLFLPESWRRLLWLLLVYAGLSKAKAEETPNCPVTLEAQVCSCYQFEDGLFLECPGATLEIVRQVLLDVNGSIQSLSLYELNREVEVLGPNLIPQGACVSHVHISQSHVRDVDDEAFSPICSCLETLSIVSSSLNFVPQKAFETLKKMIALNLENNLITELPGYSFFGLPLIKLNLKGNHLEEVAEMGFSGLEDTLSELDLSENNLEEFPLNAIRQLRLLSSLRLAWNDISIISPIDSSNLISLVFLDLSYNNFVAVPEDCFASFPSIKILSLHFNSIEDVNKLAFYSLANLESLDLSRNRLKVINRKLFVANKRLRHVDMSHNHIHHINGVFADLPQLHELYLSSNNILDVPNDAFINSRSLSELYLEDNNIKSIHMNSLDFLNDLTKLNLGYNVLTEVPYKIFENKSKLLSLNLDNNKLGSLDPKSFTDLIAVTDIRLQCNALKFIAKSLFCNCRSLQEIHLQNNNISKVDEGAFESLPNLQRVYLQKNLITNLTTVFSRTSSSLVSLHLDRNKIFNFQQEIFVSQKHIRYLWLTDNAISSIRKNDFRNLTNLEKLFVNENNITHVENYSFADLVSTKHLDLQKNHIQNVNKETFAGLIELEDLNLSENKISTIMPKSFDMLKKLRNLDLSNNFLKIIHNDLFKEGLPLRTLSLQNCSIKIIEEEAFKGLNNLNSLSLKQNLLRSEDITRISVPGLKTLKLSFNNLSQLQSDAFRLLPLIQSLYLDNCRLSYLPPDVFSNNKKLLKLSLSHNYLQDLESKLFSENLVLSDLNLSKNMLQDLPYETMANLSNLEILNLADNSITALRLQNLGTVKLKSLSLNNNKLKFVTNYTDLVFDELLIVDFSRNKLNEMPKRINANFPNLQNLNLSMNEIEECPNYEDFSEQKQFLTIDLSMNPLGFLMPRDIKLKNIAELHMIACNLSTITDSTFKFLTDLQHLTLSSNRIKDLANSPFLSMRLLQTLDLSNNQISNLRTSNFYGMQNLTSLNLSCNAIIEIDTFSTELLHLKTLDLSFNKLENIKENNFINLIELSEINLSNNRLQYLSDDCFYMQKKIKSISLRNNFLETISLKVLLTIERQIEQLSLQGNPLSCGCESRDLWMWMLEHPRAALSTDAICKKPYILYDEPLDTVHMSELCELPVISDMEVHRRGKNAMTVAWKVRNETAIRGFQVIYYPYINFADIKSELVDNKTDSVDISGLVVSTEYVVCVLAIHQESSSNAWNLSITLPIFNSKDLNTNYTNDFPFTLLEESPSSECTTFTNEEKTKKKLISNGYSLKKILTRRLGLIVGCSMGVVTFIILVSVLGYMKNKKRKLIPDQDQIGSELNYRNSLQNSEDVLLRPSMSGNYSSENILLGMNTKKMSLSSTK